MTRPAAVSPRAFTAIPRKSLTPRCVGGRCAGGFFVSSQPQPITPIPINLTAKMNCSAG